MNSKIISVASPSDQHGVQVRTTLKGGMLLMNHSEGIPVRTTLKGGIRVLNHSEGLVR